MAPGGGHLPYFSAVEREEERSLLDVSAATAGHDAPAVDDETFHELNWYVRPKPEEVKWQSIPWQTDLWEARRLAARQHRPIFLWAMNGNPLGCT